MGTTALHRVVSITCRTPSLAAAATVLFVAPAVAAGVALLPFYAAGSLIGGLDLFVFTGLFVVYPAICVALSVALIPVVAASAGVTRDETPTAAGVFEVTRRHWRRLAKWGVTLGVLGPFVRTAFIAGEPPNTALNDLGYSGRRAIFYAPQAAVYGDDGAETVERIYERSIDRYQEFHGSNVPVTGLNITARRVAAAILFPTAVLTVVGALPFAVFVALGVYLVTAYLYVKHVAHSLLYVHNAEGEADERAPPAEQLGDALKAGM